MLYISCKCVHRQINVLNSEADIYGDKEGAEFLVGVWCRLQGAPLYFVCSPPHSTLFSYTLHTGCSAVTHPPPSLSLSFIDSFLESMSTKLCLIRISEAMPKCTKLVGAQALSIDFCLSHKNKAAQGWHFDHTENQKRNASNVGWEFLSRSPDNFSQSAKTMKYWRTIT